MADLKKLDRWADKLLDTGKRNNLINFRDSKISSAEVVFPAADSIFSKCSVGHVFEVYNPHIQDEDDVSDDNPNQKKKLSKQEYITLYSPKIKSDKYLLLYAQTPNPLTAVKNISKRAKNLLDETGINVAYLAFGFVRWNEREGSDVYYRAPLLLVHVNIITGSIIDPIQIEISDDDVVVNPTFDYLLQAEYGVTLPEYKDGETLKTYYSKVTSIVKKLNWEVINECKLGIFSFLKINMYEDLKKNAENIVQNNNIKALLGEQLGNTFGGSGVGHKITNPLIELHTVVDADSSQIEAIEMAKSGKSFVLQGPPGTGKSQTITNIIAECLHDGKKVLFVSEKQAALNVVFDKLKKAGLADFCLELHSHKANKKAVIDELNRTLEVPRSRVSSTANDEIRKKREAQEKLDSYAEELHKKREPINRSLYQLFELYSSERSFPDLRTKITGLENKGQSYIHNAETLLEQYAEYVPSVGEDYRKNPWYGFTDLSITYDDRNQLKADLETLNSEYNSLQNKAKDITQEFGAENLCFNGISQWTERVSFIADSDVITPSLLTKDACSDALVNINKLKELSEQIIPVRNDITKYYTEDILRGLDGREIYTKLSGQFSGFFSRIFSGEYKNIIASIKLYSKNDVKPDYQSAMATAEQLMKIQGLSKVFNDTEEAANGAIGPCYRGVDTDWNHVLSDVYRLQTYFHKETKPFGTIAQMTCSEFTEQQPHIQELTKSLSTELSEVENAKTRVAEKFNSGLLNLEENSFSYCVNKLQGCLNDFDKLGNWINFMRLFRQLGKEDLLRFVNQSIEDRIAPYQIVGTYKKEFYKQWIESIIFSVPELSSFNRIRQDQAVQSFISKDNLQYEISKSQIKSELSQNRPNLEMVAGGSAVSILRREGQKKRKQMPIRKLLAETGDVVQLIKPCFLMSPLSVSTFLDPNVISFDTVVFDEASQIFPQDAIGAIYRGKQLIVVGDSKQMPPSNFFNASTDIEDEDEEVGDVTDFESILDICSSVFDTERLAWHYRSRYEQLIAFSNMNFYNNHLVTFPSAATDHKGIGVDYYYVDGIFDRKSKTNRIEADFIVDLVYENIKKYPNRSLGVVAFSVAQQNLIDQLLSKKREMDPSYEWFFKGDNPEPFFVKNLETVQGDERDTIIFSVAYAKDIQGRFIHNFGPLNREGGERRLNVAVTRAKENVQLVASIHYTDINTENKSEGTRLLRAYLDYAQNGAVALERAINVPEEDHFDSYFEEEVCEYLRDCGFTVDTQVGCSGYRIDMGVRIPNSSNYVLAIECDGATYHNSKNARDRDSLRQRVLENMGWKFYRIWSTDWYKNKPLEKVRLHEAVMKAMEENKKKDDLNNPTRQIKEIKRTAEQSAAKFETVVTQTNQQLPKYYQCDALKTVKKYRYDLPEAVKSILENEAPLSEEYLLKRIAPFFGREKVTSVVVDDFNSRMFYCARKGIIRRNGFLYLKDKQIVFRVPGDKRDIKYISVEELAEGLYILIKQNVRATKPSLYKTLANLLGFSRTGEAITSRFDQALTLLKKNVVVEEDGYLSLK